MNEEIHRKSRPSTLAARVLSCGFLKFCLWRWPSDFLAAIFAAQGHEVLPGRRSDAISGTCSLFDVDGVFVGFVFWRWKRRGPQS